jgi:hypothetical protein
MVVPDLLRMEFKLVCEFFPLCAISLTWPSVCLNIRTCCSGTRSGRSLRSLASVSLIDSLVSSCRNINTSSLLTPAHRRSNSDGNSGTVPLWSRGVLVWLGVVRCIHAGWGLSIGHPVLHHTIRLLFAYLSCGWIRHIFVRIFYGRFP